MASSSARQSPAPEETFQISIKNITGEVTPLTVKPTSSIADLVTQVSERTSRQPSSVRLVHSGKDLTKNKSATLAELAIAADATLHLTTPVARTGGPRRQRCTFKDCKDAAQRIVGDCGFCKGHFCGRHRLLEDHKCDGLEDCKRESHDANADKLNSERTTVIKGI